MVNCTPLPQLGHFKCFSASASIPNHAIFSALCPQAPAIRRKLFRDCLYQPFLMISIFPHGNRMNRQFANLSVMGRDKTGVIASITQFLFQSRANIEALEE